MSHGKEPVRAAYRDWPFQNYIPVFADLPAATSGVACWQAAPECDPAASLFVTKG